MTETEWTKAKMSFYRLAVKDLIYSSYYRAVTREEEWLQACHSSLTVRQ